MTGALHSGGPWGALPLVLLALAGCQASAGARAGDAGGSSRQPAPVPPVTQPSTTAPGGCHSDADCVIDLRPAGACCPGCEPRAMQRTEQQRLNGECAAIRCADPLCAPRPWVSVVRCVQGQCLLRQESNQ